MKNREFLTTIVSVVAVGIGSFFAGYQVGDTAGSRNLETAGKKGFERGTADAEKRMKPEHQAKIDSMSTKIAVLEGNTKILTSINTLLKSSEAKKSGNKNFIDGLKNASKLSLEGKSEKAEAILENRSILFSPPNCLYDGQFGNLGRGQFLQACETRQTLSFKSAIYTSESSDIRVGTERGEEIMSMGSSVTIGAGCKVQYVSLDNDWDSPKAQFQVFCN